MEIPPGFEDMTKASVILLAYRQEHYVLQAMESLKSQTHPPAEIVIVDDYSPDATVEVIGSYIAKHDSGWIFVRKEANAGVVAAARSGLSHSSGDIIIFAAGDDISEPDRVAITLDFFRENPDAYGLILGAQVMDSAGKRLNKTVNSSAGLPASFTPQSLSGYDFIAGQHACGAASAFRSQVFNDFPRVRDNVYADDRVYVFRAILLGGCHFLPDLGVLWREHGGNLSHGSGRPRGPHLASHFAGRVAAFDQHVEDLDDWVKKPSVPPKPDLTDFRADLIHERARLSLLQACHRPGLALRATASALASCWGTRRPRADGCMFFFKAALQLLMPYILQRALAHWRSHHD